jgi:hypothetical protein
MYCRCLKVLERKELFISVAFTLLRKGAWAARESMEQVSHGLRRETSRIDLSATRGLVADVLSATKDQPREASFPLSSLFYNIDVCDGPRYHESDDGFSVAVRIHNLLEDAVPVEKAVLALSCIDAGSSRRIHMECDGRQVINPGESILTFHGRDVATGRFKVDSLVFTAQNLVLSFDRDVNQLPSKGESIFRSPPITICQRPETLDIHLFPAKHTRLYVNNSLDLEICTGWNSVKSCQVTVRPATGGLRLLTTEACVVGSETGLNTSGESGVLSFNAIPSQSSVTVRFPFSVEVGISHITVKLDVTYTTEHGEFHMCKSEKVPIFLALDVSVQDVFKHDALYSRFTVSTASDSPLRLYKSELAGSDVFESHFGIPPPSTVLVFPRQPATLLYKIGRKEGQLTANLKKTIYLKLYYSVLDEELQGLVETLVTETLRNSKLREYTRLLVPIVSRHARVFLSLHNLERTALTGVMDTAFVSGIDWEAELPGIDAHGTGGIVSEIDALFKAWQKQNRQLPGEASTSLQSAKSVLIPVDVPSVPILVTADIKLNPEPSTITKLDCEGIPTVCVNQMLPATLHLKWTRRWDTDTSKGQRPPLNISFDVTSPPDQWLIGGRRRGHLRVPASETGSLDEGSTSGSLLLVPLREGWLPYPHVEIREVRHAEEQDEEVVNHGAHCETDCRNGGEVVRVVADRQRVTISLDSSGPGGGPLVLESERLCKGRALA